MSGTGRISVNDDAAALNLFIHAQFSQLDNLVEDSTFGQSLSTITHTDGTTSAGQIQVALKLIF
jgi:hypothetical protein